MDGSSVVWENKERIYGEKLKQISFTLLIKLSFWLEIFALNFVEKNLWKE